MPKRPSKKAMEGVAVAGQLWEAEQQCQGGTDSFEEIEEVEEVDDDDEGEGSSPARVSEMPSSSESSHTGWTDLFGARLLRKEGL